MTVEPMYFLLVLEWRVTSLVCLFPAGEEGSAWAVQPSFLEVAEVEEYAFWPPPAVGWQRTVAPPPAFETSLDRSRTLLLCPIVVPGWHRSLAFLASVTCCSVAV